MPQWNVEKAFIHFQIGFNDTAEVELLNGPVCDMCYQPKVRKQSEKYTFLVNQAHQSLRVQWQFFTKKSNITFIIYHSPITICWCFH